MSECLLEILTMFLVCSFLQELDQLEEGANVFKLVGPVLIPQELDEAKGTVETRIEYISKELETGKANVEGLQQVVKKRRVELLGEQQKFQALAQQAAAANQGR